MYQKVRHNFSSKIESYHNHALVQKEVSNRLAKSLEPWKLTLPAGPVLELGAGTGFFTAHLMEMLPERDLIISDISEEMLEFCDRHLTTAGTGNISYRHLDAETFQPGREKYAMVCGSFVAQWFRDPAFTIGRFTEVLEPGGLLLTAFPGHESFPEWREKCLELGLPFTGNDLPNTEEMVIKLSTGEGQVDYYEDSRTVEYPDAISFFRNLKMTGADTTLHNRKLSPEKFRLLVNHWDETAGNSVAVTWHLVFLVFKRDK